MHSLHVNVDEPIETIHPDSPKATHDDIAKGLQSIVSVSAGHPDVTNTIHAPFHTLAKLSWVQKLIPGIEKLEAEKHCGNYVAVRGEEEPFFESMPLYERMHLLFYGKEQIKVLGNKRVDEHLREQSIKQGAIYDDPKSALSIPSFIQTYSTQTDELLEPDVTKYKPFNEFFYRFDDMQLYVVE